MIVNKLRFFADEMTQQELAEKAGVSRQTIIAIEARKYSPSLELAFRFLMGTSLYSSFFISIRISFPFIPCLHTTP